MGQSIRTYRLIDVTKLLLAIIVVAIHTTDPSIQWVRGLFAIAVPYFFVSSGFLLGIKNSLDSTKKWTCRIAKLYLIWTIIYLPFTVYGYSIDEIPMAKATAVFVRNFFFVGENYMSWPLWYLLASVTGGIVIMIFQRFNLSWWLMLFVAAVFMAMRLYVDSSDFALYYQIFKTTRNGFFVGFPYMALGYSISFFLNYIENHVKIAILFGSILVATAMLPFKCNVNLTSIGLFLLTIILDVPVPIRLCKGLRKMSLMVYLCHMLFAGLLLIYTDLNKGLLLFVMTLIPTLLVSTVVSFKKTKADLLL